MSTTRTRFGAMVFLGPQDEEREMRWRRHLEKTGAMVKDEKEANKHSLWNPRPPPLKFWNETVTDILARKVAKSIASRKREARLAREQASETKTFCATALSKAPGASPRKREKPSRKQRRPLGEDASLVMDLVRSRAGVWRSPKSTSAKQQASSTKATTDTDTASGAYGAGKPTEASQPATLASVKLGAGFKPLPVASMKTGFGMSRNSELSPESERKTMHRHQDDSEEEGAVDATEKALCHYFDNALQVAKRTLLTKSGNTHLNGSDQTKLVGWATAQAMVNFTPREIVLARSVFRSYCLPGRSRIGLEGFRSLLARAGASCKQLVFAFFLHLYDSHELPEKHQILHDSWTSHCGLSFATCSTPFATSTKKRLFCKAERMLVGPGQKLKNSILIQKRKIQRPCLC